MSGDLQRKLSIAYDHVNTALWAALATFLIYFAIFVIPNIRKAQAQAEATRILEIAAEHEALCTSLGMGVGEPLHQRCIRIVQQFRAKVEKQIADEIEF
jgi:hypothetical protein